VSVTLVVVQLVGCLFSRSDSK